ncbi:chaperone DnaJ-domain superfamily protein [Striga asiatica]|uniref:Chaperone DnaJ-domain superfamily protein n=1 Tax=Striga asiatica TaxID=4170 RepID=A0A5A7RDE5_STRAF|nr:chaperone DnaJ-domain superfamily protein [Striga asiatica]
MDDLDVLARDFGLGARGKSNPMRSAPSDRRSIDDPLFGDVFGGQPNFTASSKNPNSSNKHSSMNDFDYDSIFKSSSAAGEPKNSVNSSNKPASSLPVYDKPVYDEDIFDGLPGLKNKSAAAAVRFEDDVFSTISSPPTGRSGNPGSSFDDLLGNLGRNEKAGESNMSSSAKSSSSTKGFDDLLPGFGSGSASSAASNRPIPESRWGSVPTSVSKHGNILNDPFVVLESDSTPHSSSGVFTDPLEEISKLSKSRSARVEVSSGTGGAFDNLDPLGTSGNSAHGFSSGKDHVGKDGSASRSAMPGNSSFRYSESNTAKKDPVDNFQEPPLFDMPNVSTDSQKSFHQNASSQYYEKSAQVDMSPASEGPGHQYDDVWLTVSEIPLFTHPTTAPPPSRPPPPIPRKSSKSESGSYFSSSRKKSDEFSSPSYNSHHPESPKPDWSTEKSPQASQFDELDDFAMNRSQNSADETTNSHTSTNPFSAAAASAAAMKDAMDKAEAKFRHAKEVREREYAKAARYKDSGPLERDETDSHEKDFKETQERLERERKQKEEEEEREMRRLERERSREIEREKARQAVERATREARERAAAEARLKAERAAVEKANAEARGRAERLAVQRAQAEARERAAVEARERAGKAAAEARERAAAEARERAAAEAREKETRDRAAVARAEAEARRRAERAAVERAAAEARERAAAEARERAAAASKMNQQKNDNDLESFFNMGRASSAPRARTNPTDPFSDQFQNKGGSEAAKRTPPTSGATSNMKKASSTTNFVDDLSSIFGTAPSAGEFQEVEGETEERRRARLDRHQRTQERAAKALAEKNQRDLQAQREQEERHRIAETLDFEIKRWAAGKEGNLRALLSTLQYVLWPECGWQPVSLTDLITGASVKKVYRKATLCIHPDKVQQKGATLQQKYIAEKVFDLLKEAWNKFNSEELF